MNLLLHTRRLNRVTYFRLFAVTYIFLPLLAGVGAIGATVSPPENDFKVTTVFLVRHAEKASIPPEDPPLLESGTRRSQELGRILGKAGIKAIYTSQYLRTKQTAEPLAKILGITSTVIRIRMDATNPRELSQESIKEIAERIYERAGETALIVGHSNTIPEVIKALGGDVVPTIEENEYDDLYVVTAYARGQAKVTQLKYGNE
jgi:phosphohistidine phosphatase SixA